MAGLGIDNWLRLIVWLIVGLSVYFYYSRHHSRLGNAANLGEVAITLETDQSVIGQSQGVEAVEETRAEATG